MQSARGLALRQLITEQDAASIVVFCAYFLGAKLGQYIFLELHSTPAVFWLPAGIAIAAVFLYGYRMAVPVVFAQLLAILTTGHLSIVFLVVVTLACTLQCLGGAYVLKRYGFTGEIGTAYDILLLICGAFLVSIVSPGIVGLAVAALHPAVPLVWANWSRMWAANALSILTILPLITFWRGSESRLSRRQLFNLTGIYVILGGCMYLIFWTKLAQPLGLPLVCVIWVVLSFISLRFTPRFMSVAIAGAVGIAIAGGIFTVPAHALGNQIFGDDLIFILFAPIFLIFSAVAHQWRRATEELASRVEELNVLTEQLSADDERKNQFIATLAHELRNPLAPVVSALEILGIRHENDPESMELIEIAERQTFSMRRLLDDLLDVGRISRNTLTLLKETVDVREALANAARSVESLMRERRHRLTISSPSAPLWLFADVVRLEQILVNLLNNAAKYTSAGGRIALSCTAEDGSAVIRLEDNGRGIAAEDVSQIFLPFRQTKLSPHHGNGGLGIGLSITKDLVERHGGTIEAESPGVGKGSVFIVRLPLAAHAPALTPAKKGAAAGLSRRILVVDDNEPAADGIGKLLTHRGHDVLLAYNGKEALRAARTHAPEAVLLDIGLPDIDGYEVARTLRKRESGARILLVAITGYGQREDKQKAADAGFDAHLTKPVGIDEIERTLAAVKLAQANPL